MENWRKWTISTSKREKQQESIFLIKIMVGLNVLREGDPIVRFPKDINRLELYGIDVTGINDSEYFMTQLIASVGRIIQRVHLETFNALV